MPLSDLEKKAAASVDRELLMGHVHEISKHVRLSGEPGERAAFEYIDHVLRRYGFSTEMLIHDAYISLPGPAALEVLSPMPSAIECITHAFGQSTPPSGVVAELVYADDGSEGGYAGLDVKHRFVLLDGMASPEAAMIATSMGAYGEVHMGTPDGQMHEMIVSNVWGNPDDETRANLPRTVVLSITWPQGQALKQALKVGPVRIRAKASVDTGWRKTPLLVAELKPPEHTEGDDRDRFLLLSGHLDSWYHGAMDNGSANATMIEVARIMAENRDALRRGLRVCFWSGHSHGRYAGSANYADTHWEDLERHCIMHLNTDSTGAVGATNLLDASVMAETRGVAAHAVAGITGEVFRGRRVSRNGDQSFWGVGIPSLFVSLSQQGPGPTGTGGGLGWWWHTRHDLPGKIDPGFLVRDTQVYTVVASRTLASAMLPLDYGATAEEWVTEIEALAAECGARFDLSPVVERAREFREKARRLREAADRAMTGEPSSCAEAMNKCLMRLGRVLVPTAYTRAGRHAHDPALDVPALPDLAAVTEIVATDAGSDDERFLKVRLRRGCNRVMCALRQAAELVDEALDTIDREERV